MQCPYCNKQMQQGVLRANGNIRWMSGMEKEPLVYSRSNYERQNAVLFPPYWNDKKLVGKNETIAFICPECKKMIVDFPQDE